MGKKKKISTLVSWILVFAWMAVIFLFSAQPAHESDGLSKSVTLFIIQVVKRVMPSAELTFDVAMLNHLIRKVAHFAIYLVLGVLTVNALSISGVPTFKAVVWALVICIVYAATDEIHQMFVTGRGAQVKDVLIDSAGAVVGVGVHRSIIRD
ncbi:VanZ family protein [Caldicoprobacter algeriensis]|uniref:VanZ family protein n=1 Tax=Caldicoprobacter algeriensis TaxID=699281 RepID=UPI00207964EE|nr:VanZ family protein [Caldicoprobacter algeriensis]MCM8901808.1 VanZ family protein [Caldicoprobacter algeriensis]